VSSTEVTESRMYEAAEDGRRGKVDKGLSEELSA
jgi:hypothetical protein